MIVPALLSTTTKPLLLASLPTASAALFTSAAAAAAASTTSTTTTSLFLAKASDDDDHSDNKVTSRSTSSSSSSSWTSCCSAASAIMENPRSRSVLYMGGAMALHFGGYEFFRNSCLALFTSTDYGFASPAAFPLANGLVSPFSLLLLWYYSRQLGRKGPRLALRHTTVLSIVVVLLAAASLRLCRVAHAPTAVGRAVVGLAFLFQNSYQYLLYTQHWSFVGSVLTPDQASAWFPALAGLSSLVCSLTSGLVPVLVPRTGILGLMAATAATLTACGLLGDVAYQTAQEHGFDPAKQLREQQERAEAQKAAANGGDDHSQAPRQGRLGQAAALFRRVPTLSVLFCEVLAFQSLSTILNVAFVRTLKQQVVDDVARTAYTGRFYGLVNAVSAVLQFLVLPWCMRHAEPAWIWRFMPAVPLAFCVLQVFAKTTTAGQGSLPLLAAAVFLCKTIDYAIRSVVYPMVYQPLDFESRFVGKEIIGVFASRFGKSGMSLVLSGLTTLGWVTIPRLNQLSLLAAAGWTTATFSLAQIIPRKAQAQAMVEERIQKDSETKKSQ